LRVPPEGQVLATHPPEVLVTRLISPRDHRGGVEQAPPRSYGGLLRAGVQHIARLRIHLSPKATAPCR
jgi:hypothetical protein